MEEPIDGRTTSTTPGERIIDKPELPKGGVSTDSEVYTEVVEGTPASFSLVPNAGF